MKTRVNEHARYVLSLVVDASEVEHGELLPAEALATFVRHRRAELGLTQDQASRRAGISKSTWQQIESGEGGGARNLTLHAIATPLEVDATVLFGLRAGEIGAADAMLYARPRQAVLDSIMRRCEGLRLGDLYVIEEQVKVRAELRRRQQASEAQDDLTPKHLPQAQARAGD